MIKCSFYIPVNSKCMQGNADQMYLAAFCVVYKCVKCQRQTRK